MEDIWFSGLILSLVQILFSFLSNLLSYITVPKNKQKKIWTEDKIEPQHKHILMLGCKVLGKDFKKITERKKTEKAYRWEIEHG